MPALNPVTRRDAAALALVMGIAALMRFGSPGIVEFQHDEALLSLRALDFVAGGAFPLTGIPSSAGVPNPPASVYVMALPYALTGDVLAATLFVAALNVAGVGLLWLLAHRYLNRTVAVAAALLYALNPWAILYSRKIWAQNFHTPFVLLGLLLGLYGFVEGRRWAQALTLPLLLFAFQIHFAAWALLPLHWWLVWIGRKRISRRALTVSLLLSALVLLPYAVGLRQALAENPGLIRDALNQSGGAGPALSADALTFTMRLATGVGLETWAAPQQQAALRANVPAPTGLWLLTGGFALLGAFVTLFSTANRHLITGRKGRPWREQAPLRARGGVGEGSARRGLPHQGRFPGAESLAGLLILWGALPLAVFTPAWTAIFPHYFIAAIPALALLAAVGIVWLASCLPPRPVSRFLVAALLGALLLTQGVWWRGFLRYVDTTDTPGGFGTPLHYRLTVRDALTPHDDVLIISDGFEILYDQEPALWSALLHGGARCVRTLAGDGVALFPRGEFAVVRAPDAPENPVAGLYGSGDERAFALRPAEGRYTVTRFRQAPQWNERQLTPVTPVTFANGARLTGYALERDRLLLEWELPGAAAADFHYFGHFLDGNGDRLGQHDDILWPGRFWCAGDRLITSANIDLPGGVNVLRVGLYTIERAHFVNSPVVDDAGNPVDLWVDLPLTGESAS